MTATTLGLGGQPVKFLDAYVVNFTNQLGLAQQPSTCNITLVEDTGVVFTEPTVGSYKTLFFGNFFRFDGVVTGWTKDIRNISGRQIQVNLSDVREIMKSVPIILAPGFRNIVSQLTTTECSLIDAFGAFDDFQTTGINLSGWNQAGMEYEKIALAMKGGGLNYGSFVFNVVGQVAEVFGEKYRFILDDLSAKVDPQHRINTNLVSVADFIQEVATRYSLDWYVESRRNTTDNFIDVFIRVIDRTADNVDIDLDNFLAANSGFVVEANRGYELRNEVACSVLLGAPVEQITSQNITGMANNPIDLSDEGGSNKYFMVEDEMRYVLGSYQSWLLWVAINGGFARYSMGGVPASISVPILTPNSYNDFASQIAINPQRFTNEFPTQDKNLHKVYEKLKGHAEATYGKRFLYQRPIDVDPVEAAWTVDVIAGNNDPNEYFRNNDGKTRVYVEFTPSSQLSETPREGLLGFAGNFALTKGDKAPQALPMTLRNSFDLTQATVELDKADWITRDNVQVGRSLFVAATLEEGGIVRINAPVIQTSGVTYETQEIIESLKPFISEIDADDNSINKARRAQIAMMHIHAEHPAHGKVHSRAYQPSFVHLPVRAKFVRYGPVFSSNIGPSSQGRLNIEQDDGFAPWEFGSIQTMLDAMQFKVDNESSSVKQVESASITIEGFPRYSIGQSLGFNSNINSISVSMQGRVTTTYELRSFLRRFGELSKEELAKLSLYARRGGARVLPQDTVAFIDKYRPVISRQFGGRGASSTSALDGGVSFE